jgi:hypothetical protein
MPRRAGACWAGPEEAVFQVHGTETGVPPAPSCQLHAGDAAQAMLRAGAGLVLIAPLHGGRRPPRRNFPALDEVVEQVRRAGAHSKDPEALEAMERELHVAVLAAIADGAPQAREMAAAALLTLKYGHERTRR